MALRMTEEEYAEWQRRQGLSLKPRSVECRSVPAPEPEKTPEKRSKYGNRRVEMDGMKFDSLHEARVYQELMLRVRAGELRCVLRQVPFDLPGGIRYFADFVTVRPDMSIEGVYDAKSTATKQNRVYINKKKQMQACWGIEIREV